MLRIECPEGAIAICHYRVGRYQARAGSVAQHGVPLCRRIRAIDGLCPARCCPCVIPAGSAESRSPRRAPRRSRQARAPACRVCADASPRSCVSSRFLSCVSRRCTGSLPKTASLYGYFRLIKWPTAERQRSCDQPPGGACNAICRASHAFSDICPEFSGTAGGCGFSPDLVCMGTFEV